MKLKSRRPGLKANDNLRDSESLDLEFLCALEGTLSEWNSENDDRAYRDLQP